MENKQHGDDEDKVAVFQIEEVTLGDIGTELVELSNRLRDAGEKLAGKGILDESGAFIYSKDGFENFSQEDVFAHNTGVRSAFRATLPALRQFRREYDRWERLIAEYALDEMNYSQREAASALGVAASTINRWAQHPLKIEDYR